ncbi:MAG: DNA-directed RNA polymerase subunit beta' [Planctomycetota bacterium]|jgi:DNA-directed RNA polymerase subunit beta'
MNDLTQKKDIMIGLRIASPEVIRKWSSGEVLKPETINYRTGRSERGGLFDERIFGPEKDYECYCGKYRRIRYKGIVCEKCGVEVTRSIVRRERLGHIDLASPVAHIWFLRGVPSRMSLLLGVPVTKLEKVVYFAGYIVMDMFPEERERILRELETEYKTKLKVLKTDDEKDKLKERFTTTKKEILSITKYMVLNEVQYHRFSMRYSTMFEASIGAEAIHSLFLGLDLAVLGKELEEEIATTKTKTHKEKLEKRLSLVRSLLRSGTRPEWMFLQAVPVIPPALRPMVALEGGRHATSDINDLYRRVINRNNRLKKLMTLGAPDVILRNEKRILQEAVDSLMDNSIRKGSGSVAMSQSQRRSLKSLSDHLKGKQGIFRQNLLGKRVDYSGRSVIIVGPNLKLHQCGLPKYMALELFRPFVIAQIIERELAFNIRGAGRLIEEATPEIWEILEEVIQGKYVLLNRAPTLHRLSIQAFQVVLIEGKAIQIHPMVCAAFNADFDGDQMAVHLPLSHEAQREAAELIAADKNLLKPQTGQPIATPSQDIVLGCYWMTKVVVGARGEDKIFSSPNEAIMAYDYDQLDFRAKVHVLGTSKEKYEQFGGKPFETTVGRLLFNSILPDDYPFINTELKKKDLSRIVDTIIDQYGMAATPAILDSIKNFGFKYVTISGSTVGMDDAPVPEGKPVIIAAARKEVLTIINQYNEGLISDHERYLKTIEIWEQAKKDIEVLLVDELGNAESVHDMIISGARGSLGQLNQSAGMKGVIQNAAGRLLEFPITSSYKEGHSPLEYFINTTTARKGLTDTALNTAKAGYLTRRLHDVAQDIVVTEEDCGTKKSVVATAEDFDGIDRPLAVNILGRVAAEKVVDEEGKVWVKKNELITKSLAEKIDAAGVISVRVRSPLTCETLHGLCRSCYGLDLGRNAMVKLGEAVGTVASQAIGEPGTQLTLRTFHSGGVSGHDITQGLPRVEEVFERRIPKIPAVVITEDGSVVEIKKDDDVTIVSIVSTDGAGGAKTSQTTEYTVDPRRVLLAHIVEGAAVQKGNLLTDGSADIKEVFAAGGRERAQEYVISEINKVYELHSAPVSSKHIEVIARQMFSRRQVTQPGDSKFTTGEVIEYIELINENTKIKETGGLEAKGKIVVMGITDIALTTKSWLSSASFQHTTRTLITNAVAGELDTMRGLKENVIVGGLIPAGTGFDPEFIDLELGRPVQDDREEELVSSE